MRRLLAIAGLGFVLTAGAAFADHLYTVEEHVVDPPPITTVIDPPPITVVQDPEPITIQDQDPIPHEEEEPPPGEQLIVQGEWDCVAPVDLDLVRVENTLPNADAVQLRAGCTGRIGRLEVAGVFADCIKANPPNGGVQNLVIESGFCHATAPPGGGIHQDCIQAGGGSNVSIFNFVFDCGPQGGGGNFFIAGFNDGVPMNYVCDGCAFGPRHPNQIRVNTGTGHGVKNSLVCESESGRASFIPASADLGGNTIAPLGDPRCSFSGLLAAVGG